MRFIVKLERIKPKPYESKNADDGVVFAKDAKAAKKEALEIYGFDYKILEIKG